MKKLPIARSRDIIVQELGEEILVYDLQTHKAYSLNETSAIVYKACDGTTTFDELRGRNNFPDEVILLAVDDLRRENLVEKGEGADPPFKGMSRREAIRKAGLASLVALPVISSLVAPTAAMAQSGGGGACPSTATVCVTSPATCTTAVCPPGASGTEVMPNGPCDIFAAPLPRVNCRCCS